jgi:hypothetical protein
MDLKMAMVLIKRNYLAPTVVVILALAGGMVYVWSEYKELVKQKEQLTVERKAFNDERLASERNRADLSISLLERKAELDKREFILQQLEKENQAQFSNFQQRVAEYDTASAKLKQAQADMSEAQRIKIAEEKIERLMSEFSAMGVNLNAPLKCDDAEEQAKHNAAKAKYSEIYALSEAYGLKGRYNHFFFHNGQTVIHRCRQ